MAYREQNFRRTILGTIVKIEETRDGVQRREWIRDEGGNDIGYIWTARWNQHVTACLPGADDTITRFTGGYGLTKDQAFTQLRRELISAYKTAQVAA